MSKSQEGLSLSNVDAVYAEYPFLQQYIARQRVKRFSVQRWDARLLAHSAETLSFNEPGTKAVLLLDEQGNVVDQVGLRGEKPKTSSWLWRYFEGGPVIIHGETVGQALNRLDGGDRKRIRYALDVDTFTHPTFYKLPRGCGNADEWLALQVEKDRAAIQNFA
jgi:hypothetical protein